MVSDIHIDSIIYYRGIIHTDIRITSIAILDYINYYQLHIINYHKLLSFIGITINIPIHTYFGDDNNYDFPTHPVFFVILGMIQIIVVGFVESFAWEKPCSLNILPCGKLT